MLAYGNRKKPKKKLEKELGVGQKNLIIITKKCQGLIELQTNLHLHIQFYNGLSFLYLEPWTALFSAAMLRKL